jgi:nucleoid-associated protein EbfC
LQQQFNGKIMNLFDTFKMMGRLSEAKSKIKEMNEKLPLMGVIEESPDGLIKVAVSGDKVIKSLEISENMIYPAARIDLEKRIMDTLNAALKKADALHKEEMKKSLNDVFPELAGLDLSNLPL